MKSIYYVVILLLLVMGFMACNAGGGTKKCETTADCKEGLICVDDRCKQPEQTDTGDPDVQEVSSDIPTETDEPVCIPDCSNRVCGFEPICATPCGMECADGYFCDDGLCVEGECTPDCFGRECGPDPACGAMCGPECGEGTVCNSGHCEPLECIPECLGLECGPDPVCGVPCGSCEGGILCEGGLCISECIPDCIGLECGPDPVCELSCGSCQPDSVCEDGECIEEECIPNCSGLECGPDPRCGESCGSCPDGLLCQGSQCVEEECISNCAGLECGPDPRCGESCGTCSDGLLCQGSHCVEEECIPNCAGLECGPDPVCSLSCGMCPGDSFCDDGECVSEPPGISAIVSIQIESGGNVDNYTNDGSGPLELNSEPLAMVTFDGTGSHSELPVEEYVWDLREQPAGSTSTFVSDESGETGQLFLDLVGSYVLCLTIIDANDTMSAPTCTTIFAIPSQLIHIQLVWDTDTSDMDLHLLHQNAQGQWGMGSQNQPWDCYFANKTPSWGVGVESTPSLDIDDINGYGPENINLDNPEDDHVYSVGVQYYDPHEAGESIATVRIYIHSSLESEQSRALNSQMFGTKDFWYASDIDWGSADDFSIVVVDQVTQTQ